MIRIFSSLTSKSLNRWANVAALPQQASKYLLEVVETNSGTYFQSATFSSTNANSPLPSRSHPKDTKPTRHWKPKDETVSRGSKNAYFNIRRSIDRGNAVAALAAFEEYKLLNPSPPRHVYHSMMHLYNIKGQPDEVYFMLQELINTPNTEGPNQYSFGYAMSSLKRAAHIGKLNYKEAATRALELFEIMISLGIEPNETLFNELMDNFGKAGQVDKAFELFERRLNNKIPPNIHTFSILIKACALGKQLDRAADVLFKLMPEHGVRPTAAHWNGLLSAAADCGSIDKSYEFFQRMVESGIMPDDHTDRAIAKAFASHPQLAAELVSECRALGKQVQAAHAAAEENIAAAERADNTRTTTETSGSNNSVYLEEREADGTKRYKEEQGLLEKHGATTRAYNASRGPSPSKQEPILIDGWGKWGELSANELGLAAQVSANSKVDDVKKGQLSGKEENCTTANSDSDYSGSLGGVRDGTTFEGNNNNASSSGGGGRNTNEGFNNSPLVETSSAYSSNFSNSEQIYSPVPAAMDRVQGLLYLDLHGHSQAAAQMALLKRLEALVEIWPSIEILQTQSISPYGSSNGPLPPLPEGLIIITGIGRGSREGVGVLRNAVLDALTPQGLTPIRVSNNQGRLLIPWDQLVTFSESHWKMLQREHVFALARVRYLTVGAGLAGVAAAAFIIPRLAPWLT